MNDGDRVMLANLGKLNHAMGLATRDLLHNMGSDGRLPADELRELARICDDMGRLLDNAADDVDPPDREIPTVVESAVDHPAGAVEFPPTAPAGLPNSRDQVHGDIARMCDSARRCSEQGLVEAAQNFLMAAAALAGECGCDHCPGVQRGRPPT